MPCHEGPGGSLQPWLSVYVKDVAYLCLPGDLEEHRFFLQPKAGLALFSKTNLKHGH